MKRRAAAVLVILSLSSVANAQGLGEYYQVPGTPLLTLADADAIVASHAPLTTALIDRVDFVDNYYDPPFGGGGYIPLGTLFPGITPVQQHPSGDDFVFRVTGFIDVPTAGVYTFGTHADNGVRIDVAGQTVIENVGPPFDAFTTIDLDAGLHSFEVLYFASTFADDLEVFTQLGEHTSFNSGFRLVGDDENGGFELVIPAPSTAAVLGLFTLTATRRRRCRV